jgi:succinoglycan biosynthesis protein ExoA
MGQGQDERAQPAEQTLPAPWPPVSVVMPVLNEERHVREAVRAILTQDYPGDLELVLALGPSTDRTDEIAAELAAEHPQVRTVGNPSGRTPTGLNVAIAASRHPVVVRVDGHAVLPDDYVRTAVAVLVETGADNVGGVMAAEGTTKFERAVAVAMRSPFGVGHARFHTGGPAGPADTVYLGVFRRSALERVGGYDEAFDRAQDWEMNLRIRRTGGLVWFTPGLSVAYRPRATVRALARQYRDYGRWRRVVVRQHEGSVTPRYLAAPAALLAVGVGTAAGAAGLVTGIRWLTAGLSVPAGYALGVTVAAMVTGRGQPAPIRVRLPLVYATMHGSWAVGFLTSPRGLGSPEALVGAGSDRLRRTPPVAIAPAPTTPNPPSRETSPP